MKVKVYSIIGVVAALMVSLNPIPANAEDGVTPVSSTEQAVVASPDAVLTYESPQVTTEAGSIPVVEAAPVTAPAEDPVAEPTPPAPEQTPVVAEATVTPTPVAEPVSTAAVEPTPASSSTATPLKADAPTPSADPTPTPTADPTPAPTITENPVCKQALQFTVDANGTCGDAPAGYTLADLRQDAKFELNSRQPLETADPVVLQAFEDNYLGSGSDIKDGVHIIHSVGIPGVVHYFK